MTDDIMNQAPVDNPSAFTAIIPLAFLLVLAAVAYFGVIRNSSNNKTRLTCCAWLAPSCIIQIILFVFCINGLYISNVPTLFASSLLITVSGIATLGRSWTVRAIEDLKKPVAIAVCVLRDVAVLVALVAITYFVVESPWNDRILDVYLRHVLLNAFLILSIYLILYAFGGRNGSVLCIALAVFTIIGIAQYFVALFKSSAITPSDLHALGTAAAVSSGYVFKIGAAQVVALAAAAVGFCLLAFMTPYPSMHSVSRPYQRRYYVGAHVGLGMALLISLSVFINVVSFSKDLGLSQGYWDSLNVYRNQGFLASFVTLIQNGKIEKPEGYTSEAAEQLLDTYSSRYEEASQFEGSRSDAESQFEEIHPTVIAIMNESFSDLSIYNGLNVGYEGPTRLKSMQDALYSGYVYTSVLGGGTCNSEFEFLTGESMGFIGTENQPYVMHDLSQIESLPRLFDSMGYATTAIHPESKANWNRETIYKEMGFDQFFDKDSFSDDCQTRHGLTTDGETYAKILDVLGQNEGPQFIFDVTLQNHGGYDSLDLPSDELLSYDLSWMNNDSLATNTIEYISLINQSDRELEEFLNTLRSIDRPIVVVFFGDHQPWMGTPLNESTNPGLDVNDPAYFERVYMTPYVIWANYDVAGNDQVSERKDVGLNSLQSLLFDAIGAPMTQRQKAVLGIMQDVSILNGFGYFATEDNAWHVLEAENNQSKAVEDLRWIQYLEYAEKI